MLSLIWCAWSCKPVGATSETKALVGVDGGGRHVALLLLPTVVVNNDFSVPTSKTYAMLDGPMKLAVVKCSSASKSSTRQAIRGLENLALFDLVFVVNGQLAKAGESGKAVAVGSCDLVKGATLLDPKKVHESFQSKLGQADLSDRDRLYLQSIYLAFRGPYSPGDDLKLSDTAFKYAQMVSQEYGMKLDGSQLNAFFKHWDKLLNPCAKANLKDSFYDCSPGERLSDPSDYAVKKGSIDAVELLFAKNLTKAKGLNLTDETADPSVNGQNNVAAPTLYDAPDQSPTNLMRQALSASSIDSLEGKRDELANGYQSRYSRQEASQVQDRLNTAQASFSNLGPVAEGLSPTVGPDGSANPGPLQMSFAPLNESLMANNSNYVTISGTKNSEGTPDGAYAFQYLSDGNRENGVYMGLVQNGSAGQQKAQFLDYSRDTKITNLDEFGSQRQIVESTTYSPVANSDSKVTFTDTRIQNGGSFGPRQSLMTISREGRPDVSMPVDNNSGRYQLSPAQVTALEQCGIACQARPNGAGGTLPAGPDSQNNDEKVRY